MDTVKVRTVFQALKKSRWDAEGKTDAVRRALERLADHGWLKPVEPTPGGRRSKVAAYRVHPKISTTKA
ncbi:hypothetical protein [Saccharopolyspora sp. ASAGF58]|uniref:hypothetical protein n=1 Tax=Saccharopolyspora sp. ASAGF58 TaxID=2719023 RepID=UPI00143FC126|nr:hypothetical protein [Saccharopolyspora sp. ASAGF58]QIZ37856.1 hypothetical protein FDZ84_28910 [Saccharopolyspora sp. ASAGF58]